MLIAFLYVSLFSFCLVSDFMFNIEVAAIPSTLCHKTSTSAVAEKPRDASCLSVVSFSSTKRRAQSSIVSYIGHSVFTAYN